MFRFFFNVVLNEIWKIVVLCIPLYANFEPYKNKRMGKRLQSPNFMDFIQITLASEIRGLHSMMHFCLWSTCFADILNIKPIKKTIIATFCHNALQHFFLATVWFFKNLFDLQSIAGLYIFTIPYYWLVTEILKIFGRESVASLNGCKLQSCNFNWETLRLLNDFF